jgi:hypothetical protein
VSQAPQGGVLLLLPLPVTAPPSIICGAVLQELTPALEPASEAQTLWGRLPERFLPSPNYLFAQRIAPAFLRGTQSLADFIRRVRARADGKIVVTWTPSYLYDLDRCARECFQAPDLTSRMAGIVSLRTAAFACRLLGDFPISPQPSLEQTSDALRRKAFRAVTQVQRLGLLREILDALLAKNRRLVAYMLRPEESRQALLRKALADGTPVAAATITGDCGLARVTGENHGTFSMLLHSQGMTIPLLHERADGMMIAPPGVLTPERMRRLHCSRDAAMKDLFGTPPGDQEYPEPKAPGEDPASSDADRAYLRDCYASGTVPEPPQGVSMALRGRYFMYLGDNERERISGIVYKQYCDVSARMIERRARAYARETDGLMGYLVESNEEDLRLVQLIREYPMTL